MYCTSFSPGTGDIQRGLGETIQKFSETARNAMDSPMVFFDFSMSGPRRGKSTGNSYVNPRNSTSNVSFDMKLYEWEQRVCAIRCSQSFESLKLCSLVAILEGLTPQASHSIFVVHVLRCSMWSSVKNARNFCKRLAGEPVPLPDGRQTATDCDQVATSRWWLRSWGLCECVIEADCQQCSQAIA
jgi:hypothetical protein